MRKLIGLVLALFASDATVGLAAEWPPKQISTRLGMVTFEAQRIIPREFGEHPVLRLLIGKKKFDFDSDTNVVYLPADAKIATKLNMSPFAKEPIDSYRQGIAEILSQIEGAAVFREAQKGDGAALDKVAAAFDELRSAMREALPRGELLAGYPDPE
ncbi:hypothetical protein [Methylosinus sp. LW4]|uniref:hypothetical protein n=1 Tax=Methylosinus sp. LW4 TaxID=136993 RepID=UPI0012F745FE|nr:hypothetical protein [Methylosinus sp. LW4]